MMSSQEDEKGWYSVGYEDHCEHHPHTTTITNTFFHTSLFEQAVVDLNHSQGCFAQPRNALPAPTNQKNTKPDSAKHLWQFLRGLKGVDWLLPATSSVEASKSTQPNVQAVIDKSSFDYSRKLQKHLTTEHPVLLNLAASLKKELPGQMGKAKKTERHLLSIIANLYAAWSLDPQFKVSYSRNVNRWTKSRYNPLGLSKDMPRYVDALQDLGFVEQKTGFIDHRTGNGRETRVWASPKLVEVFAGIEPSCPVTTVASNRECIILRDLDKNEIDYGTEPTEIAESRDMLGRYNALLADTFIDIPQLEDSCIVVSDEHGKPQPLWIDQSDRFVRRIFNRGDWSKGGRFYGGWWQSCPEEWRRKIFINDRPTVEIDYSGLHIAMLYAKVGLDFTKSGSDAYSVEMSDGWHLSPDESRALCKDLILVAINAEDESEAFNAFRNKQPQGSFQKGIGNGALCLLLDRLKTKHQPIAQYIASDAGIDLQRQDSEITAKLIYLFTAENEPILTIHDSYIVDMASVGKLEARMRQAFEEVMGIPAPKLEADHKIDYRTMRYLYGNASLFSAIKEDLSGLEVDPDRSDRYLVALREWRDRMA